MSAATCEAIATLRIPQLPPIRRTGPAHRADHRWWAEQRSSFRQAIVSFASIEKTPLVRRPCRVVAVVSAVATESSPRWGEDAAPIEDWRASIRGAIAASGWARDIDIRGVEVRYERRWNTPWRERHLHEGTHFTIYPEEG